MRLVYLTALGQHSDGDSITVDEEQQTQVTLQRLNELIAQSVTLIREAGLLSEDAWQHALICPDGLIHLAASRMDCTSVSDTCYPPTSPEKPRPCRAPCGAPRWPRARFCYVSASPLGHINAHQPHSAGAEAPPTALFISSASISHFTFQTKRTETDRSRPLTSPAPPSPSSVREGGCGRG